jgi:hypothetical protein
VTRKSASPTNLKRPPVTAAKKHTSGTVWNKVDYARKGYAPMIQLRFKAPSGQAVYDWVKSHGKSATAVVQAILELEMKRSQSVQAK